MRKSLFTTLFLSLVAVNFVAAVDNKPAEDENAKKKSLIAANAENAPAEGEVDEEEPVEATKS